MIKLKSILKEKLDNNEYQMVDGIIDILNQVKDMSNRKEIADNMVQQFKDENIVFDYNKFYKAIGNAIDVSEKYHYDTGLSGDEKSHAEKEFNQHHHASMYAKHFGVTADTDTVDFDDEEEDRNPGKVIPYDAKKDKIDRGYEPLSKRKFEKR
jgi:hypothetical protein